MQERRALTQNGICHLIYEIRMPPLPEGQAKARILSFLTAITETVEEGAERMLARLAAQYENDKDPKKRFRHRPYLLSLSFEITEEKRSFTVHQTIQLSRSGRMLLSRKKAARFDKKSGRLSKCETNPHRFH